VLIASDPGLSRLARALSVAAGIGVTIAVEYGFSQLAHPLWVSAPAGVHLSAKAAVALSAQHHGVSLITMLLGGIIGMVGNFAMSDVTRREQAITIVGMPVPLLGTLAISIELAPHRAIGLVGLALATGLGTYLRKFAPRFGPRVVMYGMLLFVGYFFGFLAGKELPIGQVYWPAAILWLAVLVNLALRLVVFDRVAAGRSPLVPGVWSLWRRRCSRTLRTARQPGHSVLLDWRGGWFGSTRARSRSMRSSPTRATDCNLGRPRPCTTPCSSSSCSSRTSPA